MSTQQLLEIVRGRGLRIVLDDGRPILKKPEGNEEVTDKLLSVLKRHREAIIGHLTRESHK